MKGFFPPDKFNGGDIFGIKSSVGGGGKPTDPHPANSHADVRGIRSKILSFFL